MKWWWKLYDFLFPKKFKPTPKGLALNEYLQDKINGKSVYIEEYEKIIDSWTPSEFKIFCAIYGLGIERG